MGSRGEVRRGARDGAGLVVARGFWWVVRAKNGLRTAGATYTPAPGLWSPFSPHGLDGSGGFGRPAGLDTRHGLAPRARRAAGGEGGRGRLLVGGAGEKWTEDCRCDVYARSGPVESIFSTRARRVRRIRRARRARHARRAGPAGPLRDGWGGWSVQDLAGQALDLQARAVVAQPGRIALGPGGVRGEGGQVEVGEDPRAQELRQGEGTVRGVPARSRAAARS